MVLLKAMPKDSTSRRRSSGGAPTGRPPGVPGNVAIRSPLAGAAALSAPGLDCVLNCGQFLLGRDPTCWVCIDDPLASRQHARVIVTPESVIVTDAGSANGVYVNNVKLTEPRALCHGDRLLVGATEIVFGKARSSQRPSVPPEDRTTLTGLHVEQRSVATVRAGSLDVLGRVAERMLAAGNVERAQVVLTDQLGKVLEGARGGEVVGDALCEAASRYALKLAEALPDGKWVDYTIELHLRAGRCLEPGTLADLVRAVGVVPSVDRTLVETYTVALTDGPISSARYAGPIAQQLGRLELPPPHPQ
jgi:pSer/pThr/pTyr-binding forkhead associated (FHA) protein